MVRRKNSNRLGIWMNGEYVGYWDVSGKYGKLKYADEWIINPDGRPLSLSLPFLPGNAAHEGPSVHSYFDNLLPDSTTMRERISQKYDAKSSGVFDLLLALGRDCVGAIQLLPYDETPTNIQTIEAKPLSEHDVAKILRNVVKADNMTGEVSTAEFRISIAGAQEKTALLWHNNTWNLPLNSTPSTHIFKLPLGKVGNHELDLEQSIENEWLCLELLRNYGIPTAEASITQFEDQKALCVERFDRVWHDSQTWIMRLPQEDFCQIYSLTPDEKYPSEVKGGRGVGITQVMETLNKATDADYDRDIFFATQIIFYLLQANDGHAKNFSIQHTAVNEFELTKIYDVLSFIPITGSGAHQIHLRDQSFAMGFRGSKIYYGLHKIQKRHMIQHAVSLGYNEEYVTELIHHFCELTERVIEMTRNELPEGFDKEFAESIFSVLQRRANALRAAPCKLPKQN